MTNSSAEAGEESIEWLLEIDRQHEVYLGGGEGRGIETRKERWFHNPGVREFDISEFNQLHSKEKWNGTSFSPKLISCLVGRSFLPFISIMQDREEKFLLHNSQPAHNIQIAMLPQEREIP